MRVHLVLVCTFYSTDDAADLVRLAVKAWIATVRHMLLL